MLQIERQNQLLQWLHQKRFLQTLEVAKYFNVSQMTVWRDVKLLEDHGLVKRVHGGIALPEWELGSEVSNQNLLINEPPTYTFPQSLQDPRNIALGKYVANEIIQTGDDLILEGGSTVAAVISYLEAKNVTLITKGLNTITLARVYTTVQTVLCCGGVLNQPNAIFIGPQAENFFMRTGQIGHSSVLLG
ncbi:MAG: DeoR/GlpR family DNA-binding transcription regulator [Chloroflexota bacterium]|nr:DeoR/GlpR family DNA-binding transcription regulator [Chloroflexota bacterium]